MLELLGVSKSMLWSIVSCLIALALIVIWWEKVKWWWMNTWYKFPLIGKLGRLARDQSGKDADGWSRAERTLCSDYMKFMLIQDEHDFNEKHAYLRYARESGRRVMPGYLWALTIAMVFVEAMGFSYVLAGWTVPGASEHMLQNASVGIAFVISTLLVVFTHGSGHQLYVSGRIREARSEWSESGQKTNLYGESVTLSMPQDTDAGQPSYSRMLNRYGKKHPSYAMAIGTLIFVIIVAIGATFVRGQVLNKQLTNETMNASTTSLSADPKVDDNDPLASVTVKSAPNTNNDASTQIPDADKAINDQANKKGMEEELASEKKGGWGTFIVLAVIFVALQGMGVFFGYQFGFAGEQSELAWRGIGKGRYATYADVRHQYEEIRNTAQSMLTELQQRIMAVRGSVAKEGNKAFSDFLLERRADQTRLRENELSHAKVREQMQRYTSVSAPLAAAQQTPSAAEVTPAAMNVPTALASNGVGNLDSVIQKLEGINDKEVKKQFILSLPSDVKESVIAELQRRKEEQNKMLDDIL